jgi:hypothetical protein
MADDSSNLEYGLYSSKEMFSLCSSLRGEFCGDPASNSAKVSATCRSCMMFLGTVVFTVSFDWCVLVSREPKIRLNKLRCGCFTGMVGAEAIDVVDLVSIYGGAGLPNKSSTDSDEW